MRDRHEGVRRWDLRWRGRWLQWEDSVAQQLLHNVGEVSPFTNLCDGLTWWRGANKNYVVREVYEVIHNMGNQDLERFYKKL